MRPYSRSGRFLLQPLEVLGAGNVMAKIVQPADEDTVEVLGADDRLGGPGEFGGKEDERIHLLAAQSTVRPDEFLKGTDFARLLVERGIDHDVRDVGKATGAVSR